jgi:hypothetical protein
VDPEIVVEAPSVIAPVTTIRSTLIQSSLAALRSRGHFERYVTLVSPAHRAAILETLAPEWLPVEVGHAHYRACDALELSPTELREMGEEVGERIQGTFIATLIRSARTVGLTPWLTLSQFQRLRERLSPGGGVVVVKTGPKDATIEARQIPLFGHAYFRAAFGGVIGSAIKLGAGKGVSVRLTTVSGFEQRTVYKCSWV